MISKLPEEEKMKENKIENTKRKKTKTTIEKGWIGLTFLLNLNHRKTFTCWSSLLPKPIIVAILRGTANIVFLIILPQICFDEHQFTIAIETHQEILVLDWVLISFNEFCNKNWLSNSHKNYDIFFFGVIKVQVPTS